MAAIIELLTVRVATVDMLKGILPGTAKLETVGVLLTFNSLKSLC